MFASLLDQNELRGRSMTENRENCRDEMPCLACWPKIGKEHSWYYVRGTTNMDMGVGCVGGWRSRLPDGSQVGGYPVAAHQTLGSSVLFCSILFLLWPFGCLLLLIIACPRIEEQSVNRRLKQQKTRQSVSSHIHITFRPGAPRSSRQVCAYSAY